MARSGLLTSADRTRPSVIDATVTNRTITTISNVPLPNINGLAGPARPTMLSQTRITAWTAVTAPNTVAFDARYAGQDNPIRRSRRNIERSLTISHSDDATP